MLNTANPTFKTLSKYLAILAAFTIAIGCASSNIRHVSKGWAYFEDWDTNSDRSLDVNEFVIGYDEAGFFRKWQKKLKPVADSVFLGRLFECLDRNRDNVLDSSEYGSRRVLWSFKGNMRGEKWPDNRDRVLQQAEFIQNVENQNLIRSFDLSADGQIVQAELAHAMFEVCDKDEDGRVGSMEFYLWQVYR